MEGKKGNLIAQTWEKCKLLRGGRTAASSSYLSDDDGGSKRRRKRSKRRQVAPEGCFTVYVGEEKQRFVVRTEYANHPMFRALLEEAESEFGYSPEGPLLLPCHVDLFWKVLVAMDTAEEEEEEDDEKMMIRQKSCGRFVAKNMTTSYHASSYHRHCPSPLIALNRYV